MPKKDAKLAETVTGSVTESVTIVPGSHVAPREFVGHPTATDRRSRHVPARLVAAPCPGPGPTSRRRRPWCLRPERGDGRSMAAWRRMGTRVRCSGSASSLRTLLSPGVCPASQPRYVASRAMCTAVLCAEPCCACRRRGRQPTAGATSTLASGASSVAAAASAAADALTTSPPQVVQ